MTMIMITGPGLPRSTLCYIVLVQIRQQACNTIAITEILNMMVISSCWLSLSRSRFSPLRGTCRGFSFHIRHIPGVRPPSRNPPWPPWSWPQSGSAILLLTTMIVSSSPSSSSCLSVFLAFANFHFLDKTFKFFYSSSLDVSPWSFSFFAEPYI